MSAQQREARSRGQMSTTTGSPARDLAGAGLVPDRRLRAVGDDHVVGQLAAVLLADGLHRGAHRPRRSARAAARGSAARATAIAASAAFCARRMPASSASVLARRRRTNSSVVDVELDAAGAQVVGDARAGTRAARAPRVDAQLAARAQRRSRRRSRAAVEPAASSSSRPSAHGSMTSMPCARDLVGVEHADRRGAAAVVLDVEERVDDPGRDRVEEVGASARARRR